MKSLGVAIWCLALGVFGAQLFQRPASATYLGILCIALFLYLPILLYSWLWGRQKGHIVHFVGIVVAAYFALLLFFRDSIPGILLGAGVVAGLVVLTLVTRKYRPGFVADFRNRIRRDHFARKP